MIANERYNNEVPLATDPFYKVPIPLTGKCKKKFMKHK